MATQNLEVLPIHKHSEFMTECCELINEEWPRSKTARMMMLSASCDTLPTSLVLINDKKVVLGHCKLTRLPNIPESCFLESVVISKALRGQRLGTFLMKKVEDYCRSVLKLSKVHLSTKGQENFYAKLGYEICAPVSIYGYSRMPMNSVHSCYTNEDDVSSVPKPNITINEGIPPPPPPPMPPQSDTITISALKSNKTYMFKYL